MTMATWEPDISPATEPSRAVAGSFERREANTASKWTSPPKAKVTAFPLPRQTGDKVEVVRAWVVVDVVVVVVLFDEPPLTLTKTMMKMIKTTAPVAT